MWLFGAIGVFLIVGVLAAFVAVLLLLAQPLIQSSGGSRGGAPTGTHPTTTK